MAKKIVSKVAKKKAATKKAVAKKTVGKKTVAKKKPTTEKVAAKKTAPATKKSSSSVLSEGGIAPQFSLPDESGKTVSMSDFKGKRLVIYFYPKDDTPGCTKESCDFRDSFSRVKSKGAIVLGVSRDSVKSHVKFKEKYSLPFSLLSDEAGKMTEAYGVWVKKSLYGREYMGIERTTVIVDVNASGKGTVRKLYSKVKVEGHVDQILSDLSS